MLKTVPVAASMLLYAVSSSAQTKISGSLKCDKPEVTHVVQVGDRQDHALVLTQGKCTWTTAIEMEGVKSKDDVGTGISDVRGANSQDRGYDVTTMSNGDKVFVSNQGTSRVKGEILESGQGKWSFTGGTGKFKNLKGRGTFTLKGNTDGSAVVDIDGDYSIGK